MPAAASQLVGHLLGCLCPLQVFGSWLPVAAAYAFFAVGVVIQRLAMLPVASMVFQQEAAEGGYRYKQMRLRAWATEIAMYRCAPANQPAGSSCSCCCWQCHMCWYHH